MVRVSHAGALRALAYAGLIAVAACKNSPEPTVASAASPNVAPTPIAAASGPRSTGSVKAHCERAGYVAATGAKPTLGLAAHGTQLDVTWTNEGTTPVCVLTHVATNGEHFDWITIVIGGGPGPIRNLTFVDDREHAARVSYELAPGATLTRTIDLDAWARRRVNGGRALAHGGYTVDVLYDSSRETGAWAGTLRASVTVRVP